jgi:hypothetical protein
MFDDKNFARSKLYFGSIQLLRTFSDWIEESRKDFENLVNEIISRLNGIDQREEFVRRGEKGVDIKPLLSAVEKSAEEQKVRFQALLDRIEKKQSEINSLRDGVSSQTVQLSLTQTRALARTPVNTFLAFQCHLCTRSDEEYSPESIYLHLHRGYCIFYSPEFRHCRSSSIVLVSLCSHPNGQ